MLSTNRAGDLACSSLPVLLPVVALLKLELGYRAGRCARNLPSRQDLVEVPTYSSLGNFAPDESFCKAEHASKEESCLESLDFTDDMDIISSDFGHLQTCE